MLSGCLKARGLFTPFTLAVLLGAAGACSGSSSDVARLEAEIEGLRALQTQTAAELAELKAQLGQTRGPLLGEATGGATPAADAVRTLTIANRPARGAETARVTFIEYSDYGCPYCAEYARQVYPRLIRDYVDSGKVRYVFKSYPVEELHPDAFKAHVAAACAGDQGRYWEMHDRLFADQNNFQETRFVEDARRVGLDTTTFGTCLGGTSHNAVIRQDIDEAVRGGVNGTPVFVVAMTEPSGAPVTPLRVVVGVQPYEAFAAAIDAVLATVAGMDGNHE
jgi:protein-disulfide isomerase